jgi:hypothetical protein
LPGSGVTTLPEKPTTEVGVIAEAFNEATATPLVSVQPCRGQRMEGSNQSSQLSDCYTPIASEPLNELPLTAGRELVAKNEWNTWVSGSASRTKDTRDGMDTRGTSGSLSMGIDRVVTDDLVTGLQMSISRGTSSSFGDTLRTDFTNYSVGPYVSYSLSENWLLYGSLGFGKQVVDREIVSLSGRSDASQYALNIHTEGQYLLGSIFVRPKIQLSHSRTEGDAYQLKGNILNRYFVLNMNQAASSQGTVRGAIEINRTFELWNARTVMPFIEAGVYYVYEGSGKRLTSELTYVDNNPWGGILRAGARSLLGKSTMVSFDVANTTVGINNLSIWEMQLLISHSF